MRFRSSLCFAAMFLVCFTIAAWYTRLPAQSASGNLRPTPDNQTLWKGISHPKEMRNSPNG